MRLPTVAMFGNPGGVLVSGADPADALLQVGENTGNLMFQYSCWRHTKNPLVTFNVENIDRDFDLIKNNTDVLFIPAANQINPEFELSWWAELIERMEKPLVIIGLGGQAEVGEMAELSLTPNTIRFLEAVKSRAALIGVRGTQTQALLARYGLHNTVVSGCPSTFIRSGLRGEHIQDRLRALKSKLAAGDDLSINYLFGTMEEASRASERKLYELLIGRAKRMIFQTDTKRLNYIYGKADDISDLEWEARALCGEKAPEEHLRRVKDLGKFYFDAKTWADETGKDDLSIGMRIHGAIAAIQGGGLGVCVAFDARTLELVQSMGYPHILPAQLEAASTLGELIDLVCFSPEEFDDKRSALLANAREASQQYGVLTTFQQ